MSHISDICGEDSKITFREFAFFLAPHSEICSKAFTGRHGNKPLFSGDMNFTQKSQELFKEFFQKALESEKASQRLKKEFLSRYSLRDVIKSIEGFDQNKDGRVSKAELGRLLSKWS